MYLNGFGFHPKGISMDNYFKDRATAPLDEFGKPDLEGIECLDLELFNEQMAKIIAGEEVRIPIFDFITGKPNYTQGEKIKLDSNDILIIEGIHALNPLLLSNIPKKNKLKIYIAPFSCMNFDNQNRISTTDNRLLRRIIRDNTHRGYNVEHTLSNWDSVRRGEEKNIFPFQDEADVIFNSAHVYEMGVLKTYVEPLLYSVPIDSPYYEEAVRLINMLNTFQPIPSDAVPEDSLLREFIGGSCYNS
jgi:uridine kinase